MTIGKDQVSNLFLLKLRVMAELLDKGIKLLIEEEGQGPKAVKGSVVTYNARLFLNRGDEVTQDFKSIALYGSRLATRRVGGVELIDHQTKLGRREPIAGIEKTVYGMQAGGHREVVVSPHLAYGRKGIPNLIPANAVLRIKLWVQAVQVDA
jgi:FKBP-type peptidyl-prolyl cis-trans isomerase (trigger factor)